MSLNGEKYLLTIAIPAYNAERDLAECLDSIMRCEDAEKLIEIIVINDGSRDNTLSIAQNYEKEHKNIRVIDKENGGHGSGINVGIREATGKYFKIIDSDDWVDSDALSRVLKKIAVVDCDLVSHDVVKYYTDSKTHQFMDIEGIEYERVYKVDEIDDSFTIGLPNACVKTDILKQIPMIDERCYYVDLEYTLYFIAYIKSIVAYNEHVYYYRLGSVNQSVNKDNKVKNIQHIIRVINSMTKFYEDNIINKPLGIRKYCSNIVSVGVNSLVQTAIYSGAKTHLKEMKEVLKKIKQIDKDLYKYCLSKNKTTYMCAVCPTIVLSLVSKWIRR